MQNGKSRNHQKPTQWCGELWESSDAPWISCNRIHVKGWEHDDTFPHAFSNSPAMNPFVSCWSAYRPESGTKNGLVIAHQGAQMVPCFHLHRSRRFTDGLPVEMANGNLWHIIYIYITYIYMIWIYDGYSLLRVWIGGRWSSAPTSLWQRRSLRHNRTAWSSSPANRKPCRNRRRNRRRRAWDSDLTQRLHIWYMIYIYIVSYTHIYTYHIIYMAYIAFISGMPSQHMIFQVQHGPSLRHSHDPSGSSEWPGGSVGPNRGPGMEGCALCQHEHQRRCHQSDAGRCRGWPWVARWSIGGPRIVVRIYQPYQP